MRVIILIVLFLSAQQTGYGQKRESYFDLPDSVLKREMAVFVKAASAKPFDRSSILTAIKLSRCSSDFVLFESGNLLSVNTLVSICSKPVTLNAATLKDKRRLWGVSEKLPTTQISEVRFLHNKYQLLLPDSAITGLYNPTFCINSKKNTKIGREIATNCRVYQSTDQQRVYIYMLNGEGPEQYEVTWIVRGGKYYGRVVDKIIL